MITLAFLGAARTVTGSRFLIDANGLNILIDCGLFQGLKELRKRNWEKMIIPASKIDYIILTHAHIDHSGYIPRLVKQGFSGKILTTKITKDLCEILLKDSGYLQEEEARYANKKGYSKHHPALPLYTVEDAEKSMEFFETIERNRFYFLSNGIKFRLRNAGHILGSSIIEMWIPDGDEVIKIVFSGDLGRMKTPILKDPDYIRDAQYLVLESTYGDRLHSPLDPKEELIPLIREVVRNRSVLLIPAFAVERTQEVIYHLRSLIRSGQIPPIPIFIDSPMAIKVTELFEAHREIYDEEARNILDREGHSIFRAENIFFTPTQEESKSLNDRRGPMIIISASGMATGGRILHHLKTRLPDPKNIVLMVGYQAVGTRGRLLLDGATEVKIHGNYIPVRAKISQITSFSAHADYSEILKWLRGINKRTPKKVFLVHGEDGALSSLAEKIEERYGWECIIPDYLWAVKLGKGIPEKAKEEWFIY